MPDTQTSSKESWRGVRYLPLLVLIAIANGLLYWQLRRRGYLPSLAILWQQFTSSPGSASVTAEPEFHTTIPTADLNRDRSPAAILGMPEVDPSKTSLLIEKSRYRLTLYYAGEPIKTYPMVLGDNPTGDKLREGDRRTPEGIFRIRDQYPHPEWSKFIWLDYPTDASWAKHLQAKQEGAIAWTERIGGEIGIHGVPVGKDNWIAEQVNWTWGCIALTNAEIDEIYSVVQPGTVVEILP